MPTHSERLAPVHAENSERKVGPQPEMIIRTAKNKRLKCGRIRTCYSWHVSLAIAVNAHCGRTSERSAHRVVRFDSRSCMAVWTAIGIARLERSI